MDSIEELLRKTAREQLGLVDGDYFDSMVFTSQAKALRRYINLLIEDAHGDLEYVKWKLKE